MQRCSMNKLLWTIWLESAERMRTCILLFIRHSGGKADEMTEIIMFAGLLNAGHVQKLHRMHKTRKCLQLKLKCILCALQAFKFLPVCIKIVCVQFGWRDQVDVDGTFTVLLIYHTNQLHVFGICYATINKSETHTLLKECLCL